MRDLSMSILDLAMNAIEAEATLIEITLVECIEEDLLKLEIKDNGQGMSPDARKRAITPFFTTKQAGSLGLGLPLFIEKVKQSGGSIWVESTKGLGTVVGSRMGLSHINRPPFGNIHDTLYSLIYLAPTINFIYTHQTDESVYRFETTSIKEKIRPLLITHPCVMEWIRQEIEREDLPFITY